MFAARSWRRQIGQIELSAVFDALAARGRMLRERWMPERGLANRPKQNHRQRRGREKQEQGSNPPAKPGPLR